METTTLRKKTKQVTVHSSGNKLVFIVFKQVTVHSSGNKSVFIVFEQVTVHSSGNKSLCIVLEVRRWAFSLVDQSGYASLVLVHVQTVFLFHGNCH